MTVRRILVAVDTSPGSRTAAEAAARLAVRLKAELTGLFVEDDRLLRLAESPLARQVDTLTASRGLPESSAVRRQLRLQGIRAREQLRRIANREGISWSFRVTRGSVSTEIAAAAGDADIVGLGSVGWSHRPQRTLGSVASAILEQRRSCTLLLRRPAEARPPVLVLFDGSRQGERALGLAQALALGEEKGVKVLLLGTDKKALKKGVEKILGKGAGAHIIGRIKRAEDPRLPTALAGASPGTVVLPIKGDTANEEDLQELLDAVDCPVLLVC